MAYLMKKLIKTVAGITDAGEISASDRKNAAEWCFLLSTLFVLPLLFLQDAGTPLSLLPQLCWAVLVVRAVFLAAETSRGRKKADANQMEE